MEEKYSGFSSRNYILANIEYNADFSSAFCLNYVSSVEVLCNVHMKEGREVALKTYTKIYFLPSLWSSGELTPIAFQTFGYDKVIFSVLTPNQ